MLSVSHGKSIAADTIQRKKKGNDYHAQCSLWPKSNGEALSKSCQFKCPRFSVERKRYPHLVHEWETLVMDKTWICKVNHQTHVITYHCDGGNWEGF